MTPKRKVEVRVDAYTRVCLTAIAVLLAVTVLGLWSQCAPGPIPAQAGVTGTDGFGDTNARIAAQLDEARKTNAKLDEIAKLLSSGQVKVQVMKDKDDKSGGANAQQPKVN
jgi:hypothetical protein